MKAITNKSNLLVGALLALILVMGLGYAVLAGPTSGTVTVKFVQQGDGDLSGPLTLEAIAPDGYEFDHWEGDVDPAHATDNPLTITLDGEKQIQAVFKELAADPMAVALSSFTARAMRPMGSWAWVLALALPLTAGLALVWRRRR